MWDGKYCGSSEGGKESIVRVVRVGGNVTSWKGGVHVGV